MLCLPWVIFVYYTYTHTHTPVGDIYHTYTHTHTERQGQHPHHITKNRPGVPVVAQWLANLTRNHEVSGSVPALAQWVNDLALP